MNRIKRAAKVLLNRADEVILPPEATEEDYVILGKCKPFTMTSSARLWATISASKYVGKNSIEGAFVECGVWRSGSSMAMALSLLNLNIKDRSLFLFDTFSGMTEPSDNDVDDRGVRAKEILGRTPKGDGNNVWCVAGLEDVKTNMASTVYPKELVKYIEGDIVETLKITENIPDKIALLRLDTDWYDSTKAELEVLYPKLVKGGVCIIDDYGHWEGSKQAVDEFFKSVPSILFTPIDYSARTAIKLD